MEHEAGVLKERHQAHLDGHDAHQDALEAHLAAVTQKVKQWTAQNKKIQKEVDSMREKIEKGQAKMKECKRDYNVQYPKYERIRTVRDAKGIVSQKNRELCKSQMEDIKKEIELGKWVIELIKQKVIKVKQTIDEKKLDAQKAEAAEKASAKAAEPTKEQQDKAKQLSNDLKVATECANKGKEYWCATAENMKKCNVPASMCSDDAATGAAELPESTAGNATPSGSQ